MDQKESDDFCTDMRWRGNVIAECCDCYMKRTMSYADFQTTMTNVIASIVSKQGDLATLADYDEPPEGARASVTEDGKPIYYNRRKQSDPVQYSPPPAMAPGNVGA